MKKNDIIALREEIIELQAELGKEIKNNKRLQEIVYRKLGQTARRNIQNNQTLFEKYKQLKIADFLEAVISIFEWENLPQSELDIFNSKRIESQISKLGKAVIFPSEYSYRDIRDKVTKVTDFLILPFTGASAILDYYGEFPIIKPYAAFGGEKIDFPELVVNKECVVITDFFNFNQTANNISLTMLEAIEIYCSLIADCEVSKKNNRNWIKIPLLFSAPDDYKTNYKDFDAFISEVKDIIEGVETNSNALVSKYIKNITPINTNINYYGNEFEQAKRDYENELLNFIGIGTIRNENRVRKITAEFENTSDIYNINIIKRLQNRERANEQAKKIWGSQWGGPKIKVNLQSIQNLSDTINGEESANNVSSNTDI